MTRSIERKESLIHEAWNVIKGWSHWTPKTKHADQHGTYAISIRGLRSEYIGVCKQSFHNQTQVSVMRDRVLERAVGTNRLLLVFVDEIKMDSGYVFNPQTVREVGKVNKVRSKKGVSVRVVDVDVSYGVLLGEYCSGRVEGLPGSNTMSGVQTLSEYGESD